ncbi:MAG TPA: cation:proton antiporter subunit C [Kofleriaceae bacterium]
MNSWTIYASSGVALFAVGLYGLFTSEHVVRRTIAANVLGSGVFLVLVSLARRSPTAIDPVPHALVLTGIVVSVTATACALAFARRLEPEAEASDDLDAGDPEPR